MKVPFCKVCRKNVATGTRANTCEEQDCHDKWVHYTRSKLKYSLDQARLEIHDINKIVLYANNLKKRLPRLRNFVRIQQHIDRIECQ
jgi:hypothetical protein